MTYEELMAEIGRLKAPRGILRRKPPKRDLEALEFIEAVLRGHLEPWRCPEPECGYMVKLPEDLANPRKCPKCGGNRMFPYAYLEQERMSRQMNALLQCVDHYSKKEGKEGDVARTTLRALGD